MGKISIHSPKNKFRGDITFPEPRKGVGSVISYTSNRIDELKAWLQSYAPGHIRIYENKKTYPEFDWQIVESYDAEKQ